VYLERDWENGDVTPFLSVNVWCMFLSFNKVPVNKSRLGVRFSAPIHTGPGAHPASYTMGTGSVSRV
jgi:hypothetical protein